MPAALDFHTQPMCPLLASYSFARGPLTCVLVGPADPVMIPVSLKGASRAAGIQPRSGVAAVRDRNTRAAKPRAPSPATFGLLKYPMGKAGEDPASPGVSFVSQQVSRRTNRSLKFFVEHAAGRNGKWSIVFNRIQSPVAEMSPGISLRDPRRTLRSRLPGWLKPLVAIGLLGTGGAALLANSNYVTTDNAVVTAHVVSLRAPIEGLVKTGAGEVGEPVTAGAPLATIVNPLIDGRRVGSLRAHRGRIDADLAAAQRERAALTGMLTDLTGRATRHRLMKVAQFNTDIDRIKFDQAAKTHEMAQLVRDLQRNLSLQGTVFSSRDRAG